LLRNTHQELREREGAKPATIDMEISRVSSMIRKAFDNDKINGDALKAFKRVKRKLKKGSNARKRLLSPQEYLKLLDASRSHLKPILIVAFNTGMRKGELRKLQWKHVGREKMFLRLTGDITKTGEPRDIPINHHVKTALDALPRSINHNFVFTYKGKPITHKSGFKRSFITACSDAKIPYGRKEPNGITFHDIRRTVKTNMLNSGMDKAHRDMIIGHSLEGMDAHYLVPTEDSLTEAMDRYTRWLDERLLDEKESVRQGVR
jgi:integrase